jgi:hypothetical protein
MAGVVDGTMRRRAAGAGVTVRAGRDGVAVGGRSVALAVAVGGTVVGVFAGSASEEVDATISEGADVSVSIYTTSGVESGARIGSEFGIGVAVMQPAKTKQPATQLVAFLRFT